MEDEVGNEGRTGKLDFNAPLLSTRRPGGSAAAKASHEDPRSLPLDASKRVPFLWELAPGLPKDTDTRESHVEFLPPPPGRMVKQREANNDEFGHDRDEGRSDKCDGGDDDDDDDNYDVFSDAIDMFSLSESLEVADSSSRSRRLDDLDLEAIESGAGDQSPNFIIRRFLPDANALASSSALIVSKNCSGRVTASNHCTDSRDRQIRREGGARAVVRSCSPPKACGIDLLFPWRAGHTLCGLKSPIRHGSSPNVKPQRNVRQKKSSSRGPSGIDGMDN